MSSAFVLSSELADVLDNIESKYEEKFAPKRKLEEPKNKPEVKIVPKPTMESLEELNPDSAVHENHNWMYLDKDVDNSTISYEFGLCKESNNKIYKIYICAYQINSDCEIPFLQYLLELGLTG